MNAFTAEERASGIGSSDAAAVAGVSPYQTPYEAYLRKTGELPPQEETQAMRWGTYLEPIIADIYEEETGRKLMRPSPMYRHPGRPWAFASLDRVCQDDGRVVEIKTAGIHQADKWGQPGTDQIPDQYVIQVAHQLMVTDRDVADVAVLIAGTDFRIYTLARNEALEERLWEIEEEFWERVQLRMPPEPTWLHPSTPGLISSLYGVEDGLAVDLGEQELNLVGQYQSLSQEIGKAQALRDSVKAQLLGRMGPAGLARLPDGSHLTRKETFRKSYTVRETTWIDFRVRPPKKEKVLQ